jgi:hypothetical protein
MNFISEYIYIYIYIYSQGKVKICSLLNRSRQELWDLTPIMILNIFFSNINTFLLSAELPPEIIPYYIKEWK